MIKKLILVLRRKQNALLIFLTSVLGFGTIVGIVSCEYGTPYATFTVKGHVSS